MPSYGTPVGQRTNGQTVHNLYVKVVADGDADRMSRDITITTLKYIHKWLPVFTQMGISIKVNKIRSQDLQNHRLVEAMRKRGLTRLPALMTPNGVYIGLKEISGVYDKNVKEFTAAAARPAEGLLPEDDLDNFYRDEMTFERAGEDSQEAGIGEGDDMMSSYRHMMERRDRPDSHPPRPATGRPPATTGDAPPRSLHRSLPPPHAGGRPDNIAPPRRQRANNDEDAEIQETIDRLARDIDDGTRGLAFSQSGGDSLDDEGGADPQDDLMERAYWGNQSESI
jgi:hypothetical protein